MFETLRKKNIVRPSRGHGNFSLLEILDAAGIVSDIWYCFLFFLPHSKLECWIKIPSTLLWNYVDSCKYFAEKFCLFRGKLTGWNLSNWKLKNKTYLELKRYYKSIFIESGKNIGVRLLIFEKNWRKKNEKWMQCLDWCKNELKFWC